MMSYHMERDQLILIYKGGSFYDAVSEPPSPKSRRHSPVKKLSIDRQVSIDTSTASYPKDKSKHEEVKPWWSGLPEIVLNLLGTLGFVIGSTFWIIGRPELGSVIFAIACVSSVIGQAMRGHKYYIKNDYIGVYAMIQTGLGGLVFCATSVLSLYPDSFTLICIIGYLCGSLFFLTGCVLSQFRFRLWLGVVGPLFPNTIQFIPIGCFITTGSALFTVGSIFLFYDWGVDACSWCYEIGSILFFIASWSDAVLWLTSQEKQMTNIFQTDYKTRIPEKR